VSDAGAVATDGGGPELDGGVSPACVPAAGTSEEAGFCDLFELALFDDGAGAVEAQLYGRVNLPGASTRCAVVDSVEVQSGGTMIGTMEGAGTFSAGNQNAELARGEALEAMRNRCSADEQRFGGFGFIVRGRVDGGTFEARCADAEGGGRWPPALIVTCHENVDERPWQGTYATVDSFMGSTFTSIDLSLPHGPGGAITSVEPTLRVIPHFDPWSGGPPATPFDVAGLAVGLAESSAPAIGPYTQVYLSSMTDVFGLELCPSIDVSPGPEAAPPPVMLLRISGVGERGPFSSEAYLQQCDRLRARP